MTNSLGIGKDKGTLVSHDHVGLAGQGLGHYVYLLGITSWRHLFLLSPASQGTGTAIATPEPGYSRAQGQLSCFSLPWGRCSSCYINSPALIIVYIIRWTTWLN